METVISSGESSSQNKHQKMFVYFGDICAHNNNIGNQFMTRAHFSLSSRKFRTQWMDTEEIIGIESYDNYVFILNSFNGDVYKHLVARNATIIGPLAVLYCVKYSFNDSICALIPNKLRPIFSYCMNGMTVCITGFNRQMQCELTRKIKQMGATFANDLTTSVTHLVADTVTTDKYVFATRQPSMKVLTSDWVNNCWLKYQYELLNADHISDQYKTPIFNKLNIFIARHQFDSQTLLYIKDKVESNGGQFTHFMNSEPIDMSTAIMLVRDNSEIDSTQCVDGMKRVHILWFYDSLDNGYAMSIKRYIVSADNANSFLNNGNVDQTKYSDNNSVESNHYINCMLNRLKLYETGEKFLVGCTIHAFGFDRYGTDLLRSHVTAHGAVFVEKLGPNVTHAIVKFDSVHKLRTNISLCDKNNCKFVTIMWLYDCCESKTISVDRRHEIKIANNKRKAPIDTGFPQIPSNLDLPKRIREALDRDAKSTKIRKSQINKSLAEGFREETPICWNDDMDSDSPHSEPDFERISQVCIDQNDTVIGETGDEVATIKNTGESNSTIKSDSDWSHNDLMILNKIPYLPKFIFSGYGKKKKLELSEIVHDLNGEVVNTDEPMINATHLVMKHIEMCTEKVLSALARGMWVMRDQYIYESDAKRKFVNETKFEWSYFVKQSKSQLLVNTMSENCCLAATEWRQYMADASHNGAFEHWRVLIVGKSTNLSRIEHVLKCGKASVHHVIKEDTNFDAFDYAFVDSSKYKPQRDSYRLNELIQRKLLYDFKFVCFYLINGPNDRAISSYFDKYDLKKYLIKNYSKLGEKNTRKARGDRRG